MHSMYQVEACSNSLDPQDYGYPHIRNEITKAQAGQRTCSGLLSPETWHKYSHSSTLGLEIRLLDAKFYCLSWVNEWLVKTDLYEL